MSTGNPDQDDGWLNLGLDLNSSMTNPNFTYSYSKFSCVRVFFWIHIITAYTIAGVGLLCFITRAIRPLRWFHVWLGRTYVILMLWASTTALLINNTGLPVAVLISFAVIVTGLTFGYIVIFAHYKEMNFKAFKNVQAEIKTTGVVPDDLQKEFAEEKGRIADAKTVWQRVFSWKALHGSLFFASWIGVFLRLVVTPIDINEYVCYTYPYYKPVLSSKYDGTGNDGLVPVPILDPRDIVAPWTYTGNGAWGLLMSFGMTALALAFGTVWAFGERRILGGNNSKKYQPGPDDTPESVSVNS